MQDSQIMSVGQPFGIVGVKMVDAGAVVSVRFVDEVEFEECVVESSVVGERGVDGVFVHVRKDLSVLVVGEAREKVGEVDGG